MSIHPIGTTEPMRTSPFAQSAAAGNFASVPAHDNTRAQAGAQAAQGQPGGGDGEANRLGSSLSGQSNGSSTRQGGGSQPPRQTNDWRNALSQLDQQVGRLDSAASGKPLPASQHAAFRRTDGRNALAQSTATQTGLGLSGSGLSGSSGTDRFERSTPLLHNPPDTAPTPIPQPAKDAAIGVAAGLSENLRSFSDRNPLLHDWGKNTTMWTMREAFSDVVNRATKAEVQVQQAVFDKNADKLMNMFDDAEEVLESKQSANVGKPKPEFEKLKPTIKDFGYHHWMRLGTETVQLKELNWSKFADAVKHNISNYRADVLPGTLREVATINPDKMKLFFKETLVNNNVRPITKMFAKNAEDKQIGSGIFRIAIYSYMLYEILHHTRDTYEAYKAKEDGSTSSKMRTWGHTALAFLKYSARALVGWEAGSIGFAIGRALIPIALGPLSIPGLILGGLVGAGAQLAFDSVMGTNRKDPNRDYAERPLPHKTLPNAL